MYDCIKMNKKWCIRKWRRNRTLIICRWYKSISKYSKKSILCKVNNLIILHYLNILILHIFYLYDFSWAGSILKFCCISVYFPLIKSSTDFINIKQHFYPGLSFIAFNSTLITICSCLLGRIYSSVTSKPFCIILFWVSLCL